MENINKDISPTRQLYAVAAISFAVLYALCVFVLEPTYNGALADVAVNSAVVSLLRILCVIFEHLAIYICYATVILGVYRFGKRILRGFIGIFALASAFKYLAKTAISWSYSGAIPLKWYADIVDVVYFVALEVAQFIIVAALVKQALRKAEKSDSDTAFVKLYDKKNPLMKSAAVAAATVFAIRLFLQVMNDVITIAMSGAPSRPVTWVMMILTYLSTLIVGLLCYVAIILAMRLILSKIASEK